jgi:hypothetical protein
MAEVTYIDPPAGWKYGFPKVLPEDQIHRTKEWLIEQGYPEAEIDALGENFYCRYWRQEENVDEQRL